MKFYSLEIDIFDSSAWLVGDIIGVDNKRFVSPPMIPIDDPLRREQLYIQLKEEGIRTDYTITGRVGVPVVSFKALRSITGLGGFVALNLSISGGEQRDTYHLLQIWDVVDCFDERHSNFEVHPDYDSDSVSAHLAGEYYSVTKLVIDGSRVGDRHFFRIARLGGSQIFVSQEVKDRFEAAGVTGTFFEAVN